VLAGDRHIDLTVARRVPPLCGSPQHREIATGHAERRARRAEPRDVLRRHGVCRRQLAEAKESCLVGTRRVGLDRAIDLQQRIVALDHGKRGALVVQCADLRVRLQMSAVAVHAAVKLQPLPERHGGVEAGLPRRLRVAPVHARRLCAGHIRSTLFESALARAAVADGRDDESLVVEHGRPDLVEEEVADAEADAVLRLPAAADGEELDATHVLDAVAVVGELRPDVPAHSASLENPQVAGELVAPALHPADVDHLAAGEADRRRHR